jgi:hypothetical protein
MADQLPSAEYSAKLTNWTKEPTLQDLTNDLAASKSVHDIAVGNINRWNDLNKIMGKAKPLTRKGRSSVQPKLVRRQAEWRYSALSEPFLGSEKLFEVKPATFEDGKAAQQNELVLNHQFRTKIDKVSFIDEFVRTTVDEGTALIRVGWKRKVVTVQKEVPEFTHYEVSSEEELQALQQAIEMSTADPRSYKENVSPELQAAVDYYNESQKPTVATETGKRKVPVKTVLENRPTIQVLNPDNVFIDPSCEGDLNKAMFVIISFETSRAELMKDVARYKNLDTVNWNSLSPGNDPDHATNTPSDFTISGENRKKLVAYEYWGYYDIDGSGSLTPIVATWIGNCLIRMERNPFPDEKIPLVLAKYLPVKREIYGETDAELLEDNQNIMGALMRGMIDLMGRSANGQQGFAKGMLDALNRSRYDRGQDYEFNPNMPPQQGLIEHKYPEVPQSALMMMNVMNQEAEALTGVKAFSGGLSGDSYGEVAAGIRGVLDAASKREMAILRRLSAAIVQVGLKISAMNAVFLSEEEVIRITNEQFVTVQREDLKGNFDIVVDISTAEIDEAQAKDLAFMLQTIGNNMDAGMRTMILSEIARLKRMPELAKKLETYQPQPDPMQEKLKELELKKIEMEIAELESKVALNQAKAAEAMASKDQKDLDFVEQETGTKHARDLEQQRAQSEGNQNLAVTKALVAPKKKDESLPDIEGAVGYNELSKARQQEDNISGSGRLSAQPVDNTGQRDQLAEQDPRYSLGSGYFDPEADPSLNPAINIGA